ncbi:MAG: 1-acyl-sn-glycerol-3-phosphate acyltransferase [Desulfovibrio sp.]|jgi:1-acyl-sn-glycerol-3-phosphate acyltransferase|nr:1-acyl-sn-glycerol-3-phosphate acyltransferase [Desulfovibrio sp.]
MTPVTSEFGNKFFTGNLYQSPGLSPGFFTCFFPSLSFYSRLFLGPVFRLCALAAKGLCDDAAWSQASIEVSELVEQIGGKIDIQGMDSINAVDGSCLFVANHMSTLETFMLPGIIRPRRPVTFVVKKSLTTVPFFGPVMRSREPVVVNRISPRNDLTVVLKEGKKRLDRGISIIIFPQSTRSAIFDWRYFNTIGIKLALWANVPIVPLALKTDAWGQGKKIRELGKIRPDLTVRYRFAEPVRITNRGKEEHAAICDFIGQTLQKWQSEDGVNA